MDDTRQIGKKKGCYFTDYTELFNSPTVTYLLTMKGACNRLNVWVEQHES